jgi:hypothetical protein
VNVVTIPVIYSLAIPFLILDAWVTIYQWMCFPLFGIARVSRRPYFVFDRHRLDYLTAIERVHCHFCSYANGVLGYVREVAARTEKYWCPIKHARVVPDAHRHYRDFFEYGDAAAYRKGLAQVRSTLARDTRPGGHRAQRER